MKSLTMIRFPRIGLLPIDHMLIYCIHVYADRRRLCVATCVVLWHIAVSGQVLMAVSGVVAAAPELVILAV